MFFIQSPWGSVSPTSILSANYRIVKRKRHKSIASSSLYKPFSDTYWQELTEDVRHAPGKTLHLFGFD